ncbi:MAG: hypothetical protein Q8R26_00585 [bacterium]|nr:hypothetical protein [bacterium]
MNMNGFICSSCQDACEDMKVALQVLVDPRFNKHKLFAFCSEDCFTVPVWEMANRMDSRQRVQPATIVFYKFPDSDRGGLAIRKLASWEELRMLFELKFRDMVKGVPENRVRLIEWRNDLKFKERFRLNLEKWLANENSDIFGGLSRKMFFERELLSKAPLGPSIYG